MLVTAGQFAPATAQTLRFGADVESLDRANARGLQLSYGTLWVGAWTQKWGWGYAQDSMRAAAARNVTPVIHWWFWGDDINPSCVENGCQDRYHQIWKDKATWYRMSNELADTIQRTMGGREVIVVLETEFNKNGIEEYEAFDGYLAEHARIFQSRGAKVVIAFGSWGQNHWPRFDRAIAAADLLGTQLLRSSMRESDESYGNAVDTMVMSSRYLQQRFRKDSMVIDLALSSFPSSPYESMQATVIAQLFARLPELKAAGVRGILYRMISDDPNFDTNNYHGIAERHWGLLRADGSPKPAFEQFLTGIRQESSNPAPGGGNGSGGGSSPAPSPSCNAPGAPADFRFSLQGSLVTLQWNSVSGAGAYILEAGSATGLANLATFELAQNVVQVNAPPGSYFVRVRARNQCGVSGGSNERLIQVR